MRKTSLSLIMILLLFYGTSYGQLKDFNLSSYKLPDLERKSLETNFDLYGNNSYYDLSNQNYSGNNKTAANRYYTNVIIDYNHYLNNSEYQRESDFGLNFSSDFDNTKNNGEVRNKSSIIRPSLYYQRENLKYFRTNRFLETDIYLSYQYGKNHLYSRNSFDDSESKDDVQTHSALVYLPIKIGGGRIEQVQDARHAIYIFDELSKIDRMSPEKTDKDVIEFAELISRLKSKRFFDSRLRRIAELESVDSFLVARNYLLKSDARYFSTLGDYWDYGDRPVRYSGTRFSGVILPGYYFYNYNNPGDGIFFDAGKYNLSAFLLNGGFELKHEKPINLAWQNSINLNGYFGIIEGKLNDKTASEDSKLRIPNIQLGFMQTIACYPNTRTEMSFSYSAKYVQLFDKTDEENDVLGVDGKGVKAATDLSVNYYISPKFRLNFTSSFYYIWQDSRDNETISFEDIAGSKFLLDNFLSDMNGYSNYFRTKEIVNSFRISLIYSIF